MSKSEAKDILVTLNKSSRSPVRSKLLKKIQAYLRSKGGKLEEEGVSISDLCDLDFVTLMSLGQADLVNIYL